MKPVSLQDMAAPYLVRRPICRYTFRSWWGQKRKLSLFSPLPISISICKKKCHPNRNNWIIRQHSPIMYFSISTGELKEHPGFRDIFFNMYLPRYSNKKEKNWRERLFNCHVTSRIPAKFDSLRLRKMVAILQRQTHAHNSATLGVLQHMKPPN